MAPAMASSSALPTSPAAVSSVLKGPRKARRSPPVRSRLVRPGYVSPRRRGAGTGWIEETTQFIQSVASSGRDRAAVFRYARSPYADTGFRDALRAVVRKLVGPLGDQGLLIARDHYDRIGGYPPQARRSEARLLRRLGRSSRIMLRSRIVMVG